MAELVPTDFADMKGMLASLDEIRSRIEAGEVTGFAITCVCKKGQAYHLKNVWWAQKLALIGAMEVHQDALKAELNAERMANTVRPHL